MRRLVRGPAYKTYGNKSYTKIEPLVVALARKVGCPVHLALTVEESFKTVRRAAARVRLKTGVKRDGTMVARQCTAHYPSPEFNTTSREYNPFSYNDGQKIPTTVSRRS